MDIFQKEKHITRSRKLRLWRYAKKVNGVVDEKKFYDDSYGNDYVKSLQAAIEYRDRAAVIPESKGIQIKLTEDLMWRVSQGTNKNFSILKLGYHEAYLKCMQEANIGINYLPPIPEWVKKQLIKNGKTFDDTIGTLDFKGDHFPKDVIIEYAWMPNIVRLVKSLQGWVVRVNTFSHNLKESCIKDITGPEDSLQSALKLREKMFNNFEK